MRVLRWLAVGALLIGLGVVLGFAVEMLRPHPGGGTADGGRSA